MGKGAGTCQSRPPLNMQSGATSSSQAKQKISAEEALEFFGHLSAILEEHPQTTIGNIRKYNEEFYQDWEVLLSKHHNDTPAEALHGQLIKILKIPVKKITRENLVEKEGLTQEMIEADNASLQAGVKGTFKEHDEAQQLHRPFQCCVECGQKFKTKEPFHWTSLGPVHGWGNFNVRKTCKNIIPKNNPVKKKKCIECGYLIDTFNESYHVVQAEGKKYYVHGKALNDTTGTCIHAYNMSLNKELDEKSREFALGNISVEEILAYAEDIKQEEEQFYTYIAEEEEKLKEVIQQNKKEKKTSTKTTYSKKEQIKYLEKIIYMLMENLLDTTLDEWSKQHTYASSQHWGYLKQFEKETSLRDIIQEIYQDIYKLEE